MYRKLSHLLMSLPVIAATFLCLGTPTKAIPLDQVYSLTQDEIAVLLQTTADAEVASTEEVVEAEAGGE